MSEQTNGGAASGDQGGGRLRRRRSRRHSGEPVGPGYGRKEVAVLDDRPDEEVYRMRRAERVVAALFGISAVATVFFVVAYWIDLGGRDANTIYLGVAMAVAIGFIGIAAIQWTKSIMPHEEAVQEREPLAPTDEERQATADAFSRGFEASGITRYKLLRRSFIASAGALGLLAVVPLRSLGRRPKGELNHTRWSQGKRLVTADGAPVKLGDLEFGGLATVFPEGENESVEAKADSSVILIRLRPGEDRPRKGHEDWSVEGHVAYSKICTHAGCPVGLYEQQTHHLLCPCHQSTFNVVDGCRPIFGPAARSLPQLPIAVDKDGYFVAQSDFREPVGPSFWERKEHKS